MERENIGVAQPHTKQNGPQFALSAARIVKQFGATKALDRMDIQVLPGEVHGLVGANGAGKSTLVKIFSGVVRPDLGEIVIGGWKGQALTPRRVQQLGLAAIHQEPSLALNLSIVENIVLGREKTVAGIFLPRDRQLDDVANVLRRVGLTLPPTTPLRTLSPASRQLVEIAKALYRGAHVLIMDEPTAVLGAVETTRLFELVGGLSATGVAVIYISHHLQETLDISDRVTVMRDGHAVLTAPASQLTPEALVEAMIGREVEQVAPVTTAPGKIALAVSLSAKAGSDCRTSASIYMPVKSSD